MYEQCFALISFQISIILISIKKFFKVYPNDSPLKYIIMILSESTQGIRRLLKRYLFNNIIY